jgi:hypothetical protein
MFDGSVLKNIVKVFEVSLVPCYACRCPIQVWASDIFDNILW